MTKITILTTSMIIIFMLVPVAWAHPFIDKSEPEHLSNVLVGTDNVIVWYSEGIDINFSSLEVFDSTGNRVDNADTSYYEGQTSLQVTTNMLDEGVYTVSSRVLSQVDGHLVSNAFIFAVGSATIDATSAESVGSTAQVFVIEAAAKLPGLVGQTIVLGASVALLLAWGTRRVLGAHGSDAETVHRSRFMALIGAGTILVLGSDIFMLATHASQLETHVLDALGTTFGGTILIRMEITVLLIGAWFIAERRHSLTPRWGAVFAILGLGLAATMTMISHGAASEQISAIMLDYAHNVIAGVWIGGITYLLIVMLPSLSRIGKQANAAALVMIPTFSAVFVSCIGIAAVTGPLLLWFLEDSVSLIVDSTYGTLLAAKIGFGISMVLVGAYNWRIASHSSATKSVISRLRRSLRVEVCLGVALLATVALLTNTTLPGGEAQAASISTTPAGLDTVAFSSGAVFDVNVWPLAAGSNVITVSVMDPDGGKLAHVESVRIKASSIDQNIAPIDVDLEADGDTYSGELTLGFWGQWSLEVEAVRSEGANESSSILTLVKPRIADLSFELLEYELPSGASPLYLIHDGGSTIWLSDPLAPRIWSFETQTGEFSEYGFDGAGSVTLDLDERGLVWFTDIQSSSIGSFNPQTGEFEIIRVPDFGQPVGAPIPVWINAARDGTVWVSVPNKNAILEYDTHTREFVAYASPTPESAPFAILEDRYGDIWFTEQSGDRIAKLDRGTGQIEEVMSDSPLVSAETITFDSDGNAWISEHREGGGIARIELTSGTLDRVRVSDEKALANSISFDRHQNAWFALHTVDAIAVYDPSSDELVEISIPTPNSWVQFTTADPDGNIWFAEQRPAKLGVVRITDPTLVAYERAPSPVTFTFAQLAFLPMIAVIIGASFLIVRALDKRAVSLKEFDT